jgi:hypothetical protein
MKNALLFACIISTSVCAVAAETGTATAAGTSERPSPATGPLVELTPREGSVFTAYLLSMKDGTMELQTPAGEQKQEKTSAFASIRFVPPTPVPAPAKPAVTTASATATNAATGTQTCVAHEPTPAEVKKREDHKRFLELTKKTRQGGKLTAPEEQELNELREKLPMLRAVGGVIFIKQMVNAEEDTKTAAATGKLDPYILKSRAWLKEASNDNEARIQVMRLAYAYRLQNTPLVKMVEQLDKDIEAIARESIRNTARERLQSFIDLLYLLNGERAPHY